MKKIFLVILFLFLFMFVFFKSNTWQSYKQKEIRRGMEYVVVKHRLRWDRFLNYIKNVPHDILESDFFNALPFNK